MQHESNKPIEFGKKWAILSCPRSGTMYTAAFFGAAGFRFSHEALGKNGGCGWPLILLDLSSCDTIFHQVRHPKDCISRLGRGWDARTQKYMDGGIAPDTWTYKVPGVGRGVEFWVRWNTMCEKKALLTFRVEDLLPKSPLLQRISDILEFPEIEFRDIPTNANTTGNKTKVSRDEVSRHCPQFVEQAFQMAEKYGYVWE